MGRRRKRKKYTGLSVKVEDPSSEDSINKAINLFQKKVKDSKVLYEYKQNQYFTKDSEKKRDAEHKAKMREKKRAKHYDYPGKKLL